MAQSSPFVCRIDGEDKHVDIVSATCEVVNEEDFSHFILEAFKIEGCSRIIASERVILSLDDVLQSYLNDDDVSKHFNIITQILRAFRNCASYRSIQTFMVRETHVMTHLKELFDKTLKVDKEDFLLHILLQVLHNLIVDNDEAVEEINSMFSDSLHLCIADDIFISDALAVSYNISLHLDNYNYDYLITDYTIEHYQDNLYFILLLSNAVKNASFWKAYDSRNVEHKKFIMNHLIQSETPLVVHENGIDYFASRLLDYFDSFFKNTIQGHVHEFDLTLKLLGTLSSDERNLPSLQRNKDLLIQCSAFLINVHRAEGSSMPVHEAKFPKEMSLLYNFKADLVRLIGNMCYRNTRMQDLARRAEVIPVLTASARIDEINPFIEQWCVLALRNLCEGNEENQELIRSIVNSRSGA